MKIKQNSLSMTFIILVAIAIVLLPNHTIQAKEKENTMSKTTTAVIETTQGTLEIQLMPDVAPKATENFIKLSQKNYYDGLIFHRVIKGFMIQGGDPTGTGTGGESIWGKPFADEFNADVDFDQSGVLAMANAGPNSNGSQFFITTAPTPWLHMKHTIFGKVVKGNDILKKLESVETNSRDKPVETQKIIKITIKE